MNIPKPSFEELRELYTKKFIEEFERIKPRSSNEFNRLRDKNVKGWQTIAYYNDVKCWRGLLKKLNLSPIFELKKDHIPPKFEVNFFTSCLTEM